MKKEAGTGTRRFSCFFLVLKPMRPRPQPRATRALPFLVNAAACTALVFEWLVVAASVQLASLIELQTPSLKRFRRAFPLSIYRPRRCPSVGSYHAAHHTHTRTQHSSHNAQPVQPQRRQGGGSWRRKGQAHKDGPPQKESRHRVPHSHTKTHTPPTHRRQSSSPCRAVGMLAFCLAGAWCLCFGPRPRLPRPLASRPTGVENPSMAKPPPPLTPHAHNMHTTNIQIRWSEILRYLRRLALGQCPFLACPIAAKEGPSFSAHAPKNHTYKPHRKGTFSIIRCSQTSPQALRRSWFPRIVLPTH